MQPQNPNDILNSLSQLGQQLATNLPQVSMPSLNVQLPSMGDLDSQFQQFLQRAAQDPDIVNYYNQILQQAQGDTQIAENFLEQDYQTGVRNTMANLQGSLQQLGLQFGQESQQKQNELNQRGIALTEDPSGKLTYGGGGESQTEVQQMQQGQSLRQEAEQRSAQQQVTGLATNLQKGITSQGQQLSQYAQNLNQQKQSDIANRANQYYGMYQQGQASNLAKAQMNQMNQMSGGVTSGDPNKMSQDQKQQLWVSYGHAGSAPVGYGGG